MNKIRFEDSKGYVAKFKATALYFITALLIGKISPVIGGIMGFVAFCRPSNVYYILLTLSVSLGIKVYNLISTGEVYEIYTLPGLCGFIVIAALVATILNSLNEDA